MSAESTTSTLRIAIESRVVVGWRTDGHVPSVRYHSPTGGRHHRMFARSHVPTGMIQRTDAKSAGRVKSREPGLPVRKAAARWRQFRTQCVQALNTGKVSLRLSPFRLANGFQPGCSAPNLATRCEPPRSQKAGSSSRNRLPPPQPIGIAARSCRSVANSGWPAGRGVLRVDSTSRKHASGASVPPLPAETRIALPNDFINTVIVIAGEWHHDQSSSHVRRDHLPA